MAALNFDSIGEELKNIQSVIVAFPIQPRFDALAASLALYLSLKETGKRVVPVSMLNPTVGQAVLVGINKIKQELAGQNLQISFDYLQDSIEKVSYNIEDKKFNLIVQTKSGFAPLDPKSVSYSQSGVSADLVITVGAKTLNELGEIYQKNQEAFGKKPIINLDNQTDNRNFGKINLVDQQMTLSEMVLNLIMTNKWPMNEDIAKNLFLGIRQATENFSKGVTAETFEAAAICLRNGVRIEEEKRVTEEKKEVKNIIQEVPPDWLAPKIFQSSAKV